MTPRNDAGTYMELEVVLEDHQTSEQGQTIADDLMSKLGIQQADLCSGTRTLDCITRPRITTLP